MFVRMTRRMSTYYCTKRTNIKRTALTARNSTAKKNHLPPPCWLSSFYPRSRLLVLAVTSTLSRISPECAPIIQKGQRWAGEFPVFPNDNPNKVTRCLHCISCSFELKSVRMKRYSPPRKRQPTPNPPLPCSFTFKRAFASASCTHRSIFN